MRKFLFALLPICFLLFSAQTHARWDFCKYSVPAQANTWLVYINILEQGPQNLIPYVRYTIVSSGVSFTTNWQLLSSSNFMNGGETSSIPHFITTIEIQLIDAFTGLPDPWYAIIVVPVC